MTIDVADLQCDHLADAQARAIGNGQRGLILDASRSTDQARDFIRTQHHRNLARGMHRMHVPHQFRAIKGAVEKKLQSGNRDIERDRRDAVIDQMQLIAPQVFDGCGVGRSPKKQGKPLHCADIAALSLGGEFAHPHFIKKALAQRRDGFNR